MGVIYTLAISNFSKLNNQSASLRLDTLKEYLASQKYDKEASLLCLDDCSEVYFTPDGIEESVCFSYELDNNKLGDQILIEYKNSYYDMSTYFEQTPVYNSIQEARDVREKLRNEVLQWYLNIQVLMLMVKKLAIK